MTTRSAGPIIHPAWFVRDMPGEGNWMFASKPAGVLFVVACLGLGLLAAPPALAQQSQDPPDLINIAEAGAGYGWFSDPFGTGEGLFARYTVMRPGAFTMRFEANYGSRFDQIGRTIGFSYARVLPNRMILPNRLWSARYAVSGLKPGTSSCIRMSE